MRRTYISPEFKYIETDGSFSMVEKNSFFGSKQMDIDDIIELNNGSVIYYQQKNQEQIDFDIERSLPKNSFSISRAKKDLSKLVIDESQSDLDRKKNTKWILTVDLKSLLRNYIFARIKESRAFEGVRNNKTRLNYVNLAIFDYIDVNVLDRYRFDGFRLYLTYNKLLQNNGTFAKQNVWSDSIDNIKNLETKVRANLKFDESEIELSFAQDEPSDKSNFHYYYEATFKKKDGTSFSVEEEVEKSNDDTGGKKGKINNGQGDGTVGGVPVALKQDMVKEWGRLGTELFLLENWLNAKPILRKLQIEVSKIPRREANKTIGKGGTNAGKGLTAKGNELTTAYLNKIKKVKIPGTLSVNTKASDLLSLLNLIDIG